jgi:two-component system, NarL family, response regulator NreC
MSKIRVLHSDDHALFRQGVRNLLMAEPDMEVVGEAADAGEAIVQARQHRPDIVLMDIGMKGLSSFEAARTIRRERPQTRIVFLSMYDDDDYLAECVEVGASGYVLKESPAEQLVTALREVQKGGSYLTPRLLTRLVEDFRSNGPGTARRPGFNSLTRREREVLKMLAEGRSVKEIAAGFELSVKTVEAHKFNLMRKLNIHNKAQLVQYAIQKKVIRLPEPVMA